MTNHRNSCTHVKQIRTLKKGVENETGTGAYIYIIKKAKKSCYTDRQIAAFAFEVQEKIAEMPETDEEELDQLFEELF